MADNQTTKRKPKKKSVDFSAGLFEIESNPPTPVRGISKENQEFYAKMKRTIALVDRGQSFLIPASKKNAAQKFFKQHFNQEKFSIYKAADKDGMLRVYRMKAARMFNTANNG